MDEIGSCDRRAMANAATIAALFGALACEKPSTPAAVATDVQLSPQSVATAPSPIPVAKGPVQPTLEDLWMSRLSSTRRASA